MIITLLVTLAVTLFYAHYFFIVKKNYYILDFEDVNGISTGTPVRFMGIVVGHVRKLASENDRIMVQIVVTKPGVKIPGGSKAKVEFTGIVGSKSIEIMPPEENGEHKGIITQNPFKIGNLMDSMDTINRDIYLLGSSTEKFKKLSDKVLGLLPEKYIIKFLP